MAGPGDQLTAPPAASSLTNSAQTTAGPVRESAGFLERPDGTLFMVLHEPAEQPPSGVLIVCSSLFAEQHTDYRREVRLARTIATAGLAVARFHYRGVGNSAAGPMSLDAFARDALDVTVAATRLTSAGRVAFLGAGAGALVAARALSAYRGAPLLLWKPVIDGGHFFRDFFRARLIAATRAGGARPATTEESLATLAREGQLDVMGFTVTTSLYDSLVTRRLADTLPQAGGVLLQPFRGSRAAAADRLAADWTARGVLVDVQPVKLAEDPWFIPDGAAVAAAMQATEAQLMTGTRDWLLRTWATG